MASFRHPQLRARFRNRFDIYRGLIEIHVIRERAGVAHVCTTTLDIDNVTFGKY